MRIVLQPSRILKDHFAAEKARDPLSLDWEGLCDLFLRGLEEGPIRQRRAELLRRLAVGGYVGFSSPRTPTGSAGDSRRLFVFLNPAGGDFSSVLARDPTFDQRVEEVYRVECVEHDGTQVQAIE